MFESAPDCLLCVNNVTIFKNYVTLKTGCEIIFIILLILIYILS
jgi:hypothetical protein